MAIFTVFAAGIAQAQEPSPPYDPANVAIPERPPAAQLADGIYAQNCAPCHGITGAGDGPARSGASMEPAVFADVEAVWALSPAQLFHTTKFGRIEKLMPPWQNSLTDDQIWQAVYYAWGLHTNEEELATGTALFAQSCASCHGDSGQGDGPDAAGSMPNFSDQASMIFISQEQLDQGWKTAHPEIGADWTDDQRRAVLEAVRAFSYQPSWAALSLSGPGIITGRVEQGTGDGTTVSSAAISLNVYQQTDLLTTLSGQTGEDGGFVFENLPVDTGYYFLVETEYAGIRYTSPILAFSGPDFTEDRVGPERIETTLPVYETTADGSRVEISRANWIIEHEPGALLIGQVFTFGNLADRTFVGTTAEGADQPVTLAIRLPAGAENIGLQDGAIGGVYRQIGDTIYDTRPVPPGRDSRQVFVRYRLPFSGSATTVQFPVEYEIRNLNLLVAELPGLSVDLETNTDTLQNADAETIQGVVFQRWSGPVPAGEPVQIALSGLVAAGAQDPRQGSETQVNRELPVAAPPLDPRIPLALGSVIGIVLLGALIVYMRQQRPADGPSAAQLAQRRQELTAQIARLDDLRALGEITDSEWQSRRARLKGELLSVAQLYENTEAGHE